MPNVVIDSDSCVQSDSDAGPIQVRETIYSLKLEYAHVTYDILDTFRGYQTNEDKDVHILKFSPLSRSPLKM